MISYEQLRAAIRELNDIQASYPTEDVMDDVTLAAFERDLEIITRYKQQCSQQESHQFPQEKGASADENPVRTIPPQIPPSAPPKASAKIRQTDRSKYEDSCIFLYILTQLYNTAPTAQKLQAAQKKAQQYKQDYEKRIRHPGDKLILFGKSVAECLLTNNQKALGELRREVSQMPHPERHHRILSSVHRILKWIDAQQRQKR